MASSGSSSSCLSPAIDVRGYTSQHHSLRNLVSLQHSLLRSDRNLVLQLHEDLNHYHSLLRDCIVENNLKQGMQIHDSLVQNSLDGDNFFGYLLVALYSKCDALMEARQTFDRLKVKNVYAWNNVIAAYIRHGCYKEALEMFYKMLDSEIPSSFTFTYVLRACNNLDALDDGRYIHENAIYAGRDNEIMIGTALINMYGKCGSAADSERVFNRLHERNIVTYTAMIAAYVHHGNEHDALKLFRFIIHNKVILDEFCCSTVLGACSGLQGLEEGRFIHAAIILAGFQMNSVIESALVNMYGKCSQFEDAIIVFAKSYVRNIALFTSIITTCVQLEQWEIALELFMELLNKGLEPNEITYVSVISACAGSLNLFKGKVVYDMIVSSSLESNVIVASAIMNMFGKCGCLDDAQAVFDKMLQPTVVTWNVLITAYAQQGNEEKVLELFNQMLLQGVRPNEITYINVLSVCGMSACSADGKHLHMTITKCGLESLSVIENSLVSMYGKYGTLVDALYTFRRMEGQDLVSWNAIIAAYTQYGDQNEAFQLFKKMHKQGIKPDDVTFVSILSACSRAGLVTEGFQYFFSMSDDFGIEPTMGHYGCMIDLLGRAGQLEKVEGLIKRMPEPPDYVAWKSFLAACNFHRDKEKGQLIAEIAFDDETKEAPPYILLSNIYTQ